MSQIIEKLTTEFTNREGKYMYGKLRKEQLKTNFHA